MSIVYADEIFESREISCSAQANFFYDEADSVAAFRKKLREAREIAARYQSDYLSNFWVDALSEIDSIIKDSNRQVLENAEIQRQIDKRLSK